MELIDAHQHFWKTSRTDYGWLTPDLGAIYRDFLPDDLQPLLAAAGIDRTVLVQAAPSEAETQFLLDLADRHQFIAGVVGWVDLEAANAAERIAQIATHKKLLGLRPMVQDIAETDWLLGPGLRSAIEAMIAHDLPFDALIQPRHLPVLRSFVTAYPDLRIIIDHGAKPDIANGVMQPWADRIAVLARETDICCKLSGLVTEAAADWRPDDLRPYVKVLIDAFGPERLIWGSDWPVLNLASDYATWHALATDMLEGFSADERAQILGGNAARFYGLNE